MDLTHNKGILILIEDANNQNLWESQKRELIEIARSAGLEILEVVKCRVKHPFYRYYIGKGKVQEIREFLKENPSINFTLFSVEITPSQQRNLEETWEVPVYTKDEIIHEIFAQRAHTAQGKIKVELAKLRYKLSRLTGKGNQLSRLGGGIGTRGPGEQKIEVERRKIRDRITFLRRTLKTIEKQMEIQRSSRLQKGIPQIAIVGYTNAGKSTLFNVLTRSQVYVESRMFATLDPTAKRGYISGIGEVIFIDTVGFIRTMPPTIKEAFRATLEEIKEADLILEIIDIADPDYRFHFQTIHETLREIGLQEYPRIIVFNKIDLLPNLPFIDSELRNNYPHAFISAKNKINLDALIEKISLCLQPLMSYVSIEIEYSKLPLVEREIYHQGYIKNVKPTSPERILLECFVRKEALPRIRALL